MLTFDYTSILSRLHCPLYDPNGDFNIGDGEQNATKLNHFRAIATPFIFTADGP